MLFFVIELKTYLKKVMVNSKFLTIFEERTMTKKKSISMLSKEQPLFLGIDVHKKNWSICFVQKEETIFRCSISTGIEGLKKILDRFDGTTIYSVYEAGFSGFHLHYQLTEIGVNNILTPPNKIPTLTGDKVKTDRRDSHKLAYYLSKGLLKSIHVPSKEELDRRQMIRTREQYVDKRRRVINQIKSLVIQWGISFDKKCLSKAERLFLKKEAGLSENVLLSVNLYLEELEFLEILIKKTENALIKIRKVPQVRKHVAQLRSIDGIGRITATTFALEIGDTSRFLNSKQLSSYVGLTPSEYSSGDYVRRGRITGQGNPQLRGLIVEASWKMISKNIIAKEIFDRLWKQTGSKKKAIVGVARRLVVWIHSMFRKGEIFQIQNKLSKAII